MMMKRFMLGVLSAGLCWVGLGSPVPENNAYRHMPVKAAESEPAVRAADNRFSASVIRFSDRLLKQYAAESADKNLVLSPLSVIYALTLCSNGASGETLAEFEELNGIPVSEMNEYLFTYAQKLAETENSTVRTANSLWGNKNFFRIAEDFRTVSEKYYAAESDSLHFNDPASMDRINGWVSEKTDGMIPQALDELDPAAVLLILNTVLFDGVWQNPYEEREINESVFCSADGTEDLTEFMYSTEHSYFEVDGGVGFSKAYKDGYTFTAVLPDGDPGEFIANADLAEVVSAALAGTGKVEVSIPKFEYENKIGLTEILRKMGLERAFSNRAELYGLSENGAPLYIDQVLQKAKIITNEHGTKAAAMTEISIRMMAFRPTEKKEIHLNRPFFYMILDTETGIPLFTGAVYDLGE
ncbi:MAG: serpin family protein [Clostridia bacterium]|nr:serpin family protein [Clostridia bacterium]